MLSVLAASKATSWAAASCSHETTSWMEKVRAPRLRRVGGFALEPAYRGLAWGGLWQRSVLTESIVLPVGKKLDANQDPPHGNRAVA